MYFPRDMHYIICDLCGVYAPDTFDSREAAKEEAINLGWLADLADNGHQLSDWSDGEDFCAHCGTWQMLWSQKDCPLWLVVCKTCQAATEEFQIDF